MASANAPVVESGAGDVSPTASAGLGPAKMRKRTKTGCLTCRKRRIKCGEERPTCANCIKSKRQCEGYNQRVIFKTPLEGWPNHPGVVSTLQYHNSMLPGSRNTGFRPPQSPTQTQESTLTSIQPRPLSHYEYPETGPALGPLNTQQVFVGGIPPYGQDGHFQQPLASPHHHQPLPSPHHQLPTPTSAASYFAQPSPVQANFHSQYGQEGSAGFEEQQQRYSQAPYQNAPASYDAHVDQKPSVSQASQEQAYYPSRHPPTNRPAEQNPYAPQPNVSPQTGDFVSHFPQHRSPIRRYSSQSHAESQQPLTTSADYSQADSYPLPLVSIASPTHSPFPPAQIPQHDVSSDVKYMHQHAVYEPPVHDSNVRNNEPNILLSGFGGEDHLSPTQVLDEAAVEEVDDDYWDVQSDEEMLDGVDENDNDAMILNRDFSLIRRIHFENSSELAIRRYDAFIYEGMLSQYRPEQVANPLKNPKTARVFAHFIHVTGPSLSIYERNPRNSSSIFEGPTPYSQQSLHTYILPLKALNNQGLLHAQLALASLHIAKLQRASVTPSWKHYAYALKRLGRSLGNPKKRLSIATLATSLLLAYYEVMTAEHVKWGTHLVGSAQLMAELDFPSLTQEARRLRAAQVARESNFPYQNPNMLIDQKLLDQKLKESTMMPDETLISTIVGMTVRYDDYGRVFEDVDMNQGPRQGFRGKLDLRTFETLQDLYWFYMRQDAYQSILSGNPLVTDYRKWADCPPRAPLGRTDALYGTHDHIVLLIGRISDFAVRDRERKIRQVKADGGQWRPRPGMPGMPMGPPPTPGSSEKPRTSTAPMGPPPHMRGMGGSNTGPSAGQGHPQGQGPPRGPPPGNAGPDFYGMAPSRPPIPLPASYANPSFRPSQPSTTTPIPPHSSSSDLSAAYEAALGEWNSISHAHATIAHHLANTPGFAALTPDLYPVAPGGNMTPFGPALVHRSYDISTLWTMLHLSNILLLRSHPSMPAPAMVAAGVCAQATQPYATLIGRISAGMQVPASDEIPLSPFLGAALLQTTMALFFAGIQYQAPDQRNWLVKRLLDIDRRTGWASAASIARSCETVWEKAADMGRGPPYQQRKTRRHGEEGPVVLDADELAAQARSNSSLGGERPAAPGGGEGQRKGFVVEQSATRQIPWAQNLLATDEDIKAKMENMGLGR